MVTLRGCPGKGEGRCSAPAGPGASVMGIRRGLPACAVLCRSPRAGAQAASPCGAQRGREGEREGGERTMEPGDPGPRKAQKCKSRLLPGARYNGRERGRRERESERAREEEGRERGKARRGERRGEGGAPLAGRQPGPAPTTRRVPPGAPPSFLRRAPRSCSCLPSCQV